MHLGRVTVQVHHVGRFFGRLRAGVHGDSDVGLGQGRGIVGAVAHHSDQFPLGLLLADIRQLGLRCSLREEVIHPRLLGNGRGRQRVIARNHDGAQPHAPQARKALADPGFQDVLEHHHPSDAGAVGDHQWGGAL